MHTHNVIGTHGFTIMSAEADSLRLGRASLARENEAGGTWGQEVHILHVNI